jgi:hypothetical protein
MAINFDTRQGFGAIFFNTCPTFKWGLEGLGLVHKSGQLKPH